MKSPNSRDELEAVYWLDEVLKRNTVEFKRLPRAIRDAKFSSEDHPHDL